MPKNNLTRKQAVVKMIEGEKVSNSAHRQGTYMAFDKSQGFEFFAGDSRESIQEGMRSEEGYFVFDDVKAGLKSDMDVLISQLEVLKDKIKELRDEYRS